MDDALEPVLRRAVTRGELPPDADVPRLVAFLGSQLAGLAVLARAGASEDELVGIATFAVDALAGETVPVSPVVQPT